MYIYSIILHRVNNIICYFPYMDESIMRSVYIMA
jgi:hypothetical protein